jgi:hypothetical protein
MPVARSLTSFRCALVLLAFCTLIMSPVSYAQRRLNDKELEKVMKNLKEDAKDFRSTFGSSVKKSAIRNTDREKDAKKLTEQFEHKTDDMWKHFKDHKNVDPEAQEVIDLAGQIDRVVYSAGLDSKATLSWEKVRSELHEISAAYGVQEPYLQSTASQSLTNTGSCVASLGAAQAQKLVDRCLQVSPATHPPCNGQNACSLITDEIRRGCGLLASGGAPAFCSEYR